MERWSLEGTNSGATPNDFGMCAGGFKFPLPGEHLIRCRRPILVRLAVNPFVTQKQDATEGSKGKKRAYLLANRPMQYTHF